MLGKQGLFFSFLLLTGCLVGPNYRPPVLCLPEGYSEVCSAPSEPQDHDELASWWCCFNDPFLESLLAESIEGNFDWKIALEKICQARANYWMSVTSLLPDFESNAQATRSRTSQTVAGSTFAFLPPINNFYQAGIDAIWQLDLFGGLRRAAMASGDLWDASIESARDVGITLLSEVAMNYINIRALQEALCIANERVEVDEQLVVLTEVLYLAGLADYGRLDQLIAIREADRALALDYDTNFRQAVYGLAVLLGRPPEGLLERFLEKQPIPCAYGKIPIGLPSDLLRRRPDIRMQEREIAAATEQIGVSVAALFPQFALTGSTASYSANPLQGANAGFASSSLSKLFTKPSMVWGLGILTSLPIFDFGKRMAAIRGQQSVAREALFSYEKTVITALQEVESALAAYLNDEEKLLVLDCEVEAIEDNVRLKKALFEAGFATPSDLLNARLALLNALNARNLGRQALATDVVALYNALGGGWCISMP